MSPDVEMVCPNCNTVTLVEKIIYLTGDHDFEVVCLECGKAVRYGDKK